MKIVIVTYKNSEHKFLERRLKQYNIPYDMIKNTEVIDYLNHTIPDIICIVGSRLMVTEFYYTSDGRLVSYNPHREYPEIAKILALKHTTIIGICFGFQVLAKATGGKLISKEPNKHYGYKTCVYRGNYYDVWFNHYIRVISLPNQWDIKMTKDDFITYAVRKNIHGFQFQPEKRPDTFEAFILPIFEKVQRRLERRRN